MDSTRFSPIKVSSVAEAVASQIRQMILDRQLKPSDKLPNEIELARTMSVGRPAVREALRSLQSLGLIERTKEGTFIRNVDHEILNEPLNCLLALVPGSLHELFECRRILEVAAASQAARCATDDDLEKLEYCMQRMEYLQDKNQEFVEANFSFHCQVVAAAHNSILLALYQSLAQQIKEAQLCLSTIPGGIPSSLSQHRRILKTLSDRDPEAASQAMLEHISDAEGLSSSNEDMETQSE